MRQIKMTFLAVALCLLTAGMAMAIDIPSVTSWSGGAGLPLIPGLSIQGVGGGLTGFGDVLISPLYDVRALIDPNLPGAAGTTARAQDTLIAIVNTDPQWGVVARLRFREWKRSFECLDLDIPLTSNDVWVGVVSQKASGVASLSSPDRYVSAIPLNLNDPFTTSLFPVDGIDFRTANIEPGEANPTARCLYGYFEIIGEEKVNAPTPTFPFLFPRVGTIVNNVYLPGANDPPNVLGGGRDVDNVLMGTTYIIRPDVAISHQFNMTAIANFAVDPRGIWASTATVFPTLQSAVQGQGGNPGAGGFDNLEALLSKRFVDFQYTDQGQLGGFDPLDLSQTPMSTSVVVTFPTKWAHYSATTPFPIGGISGGAPFTGPRETVGDGPDFGEIYTAAIFDRNEHRLTTTTDAISPSPTPGIVRLPYEVNILGLRPVDPPVIDFRNNLVIPTANNATAQKFWSGWGELDLSPIVGFNAADTRVVPQGKVVLAGFNFFNNIFNAYRGLPAIGVVMTEFYNGQVSGYYGNTVPWQYGVDWRINGSLIIPPQ